MPPKKKELRSKVLADGSLRLSIPCFNKTRDESLTETKDVKLLVGSDKILIEAHKKVLCTHIPYFNAMFSGSFHESTQEVIDLPDIESDVPVRKLVDLFYKGTLAVTTQDVQDLFVVCDIWGLDAVRSHCVNFMIQELDCHNCFDLLSLGEMYSIQNIVDISRDLISREFQIISKLDSFVDLPVNVLMSLVQRMDLNMGYSKEDVMLKAVTRWLRHNWPEREKHLKDLLPHIKYSRCSQQIREDFISLHPETIKKVVDERMAPYIHEPGWIWLPSDYEPTRKHREKIMAFCGHSHTRISPVSPKLKSVEMFNVDTRNSCSVDLSEAPSYGVAFNLFGRIIYFAVFVHTDPATKKPIVNSEIYTFRPEQPVSTNLYRVTPNVFSKEASDCIRRCLISNGCVAHCPMKNRIYTVTVQNVDCLKLICSNGEEKPLPNLKEFLHDSHVGMRSACCKGKLYVIGGRWGPELEVDVSNIMLVLNGEDMLWKKIFFNMSRPRSDFAVAVNGHTMVVSGGFGGYEHPKRLRDCERFADNDPIWCCFAPLRQYKTHHCMVVANGTFYALGGKTYASHKLINADEGGWQPGGARIVSNLIEKYHKDTVSWERFGKLKKGRCMFSAISV